jgi:hypothetical protein
MSSRFSSKAARMASRSLNGTTTVSATAAAGTPPEPGMPSVTTPEPAFASSMSPWPW